MTRSVIQLIGASLGVDGKQIIHSLHDACRYDVLRMQLYRIDELSLRMRPTHGMSHLRPADVVVGGIAVGLQNTIKLVEKLLRSFASTAEAKVEDHAAARCPILPKIGLMVPTATITHLHVCRRLIGPHATPTA